MVPREFLGAFKAGHRPSARGFIDDELAHRLLRKVIKEGCEESRRALEFITKFNNEYYKGVVKKGDELALHAQSEERLECYRRQYRQRLDAFNFISMNLQEGIVQRKI